MCVHESKNNKKMAQNDDFFFFSCKCVTKTSVISFIHTHTHTRQNRPKMREHNFKQNTYDKNYPEQNLYQHE